MYHDRECGLTKVWLKNGFRKIDTPYGKVVEIEHVEELHRAASPTCRRGHWPRCLGIRVRAWRYGRKAAARRNGPTA